MAGGTSPAWNGGIHRQESVGKASQGNDWTSGRCTTTGCDCMRTCPEWEPEFINWTLAGEYTTNLRIKTG